MANAITTIRKRTHTHQQTVRLGSFTWTVLPLANRESLEIIKYKEIKFYKLCFSTVARCKYIKILMQSLIVKQKCIMAHLF